MDKFTDFAQQQNAIGFKEKFDEVIGNKVADVLDSLKIDIAQNMFGGDEVPNNDEPVNEEAEQIDEKSYSAKAARAGKDIGKKGKNFSKIAASAAERYGSEESGKRVAGAVLKKLRANEEIEENEETQQVQEVAPEGWEGTVKAMKKHKDIKNPWALAWSMKNKGYKSHKK